MSEQKITINAQEYQDLYDRIRALEQRLAQEDNGSSEEPEQDPNERFAENTERALKESAKIIRCFMDASAVAISEAVKAMDGLRDDIDSDEVPDGLIKVFRKAIEIQSKAVDTFDERYHQENVDET